MSTSCCEVVLRLSVHPQWKSSARLRSVSAVTTTAASTATSCVTLSMTAATALMRDRRTVSRTVVLFFSFSEHASAASLELICFCPIQAKVPLMDPVRMMSTNAVTDNASLCSTPVMIMMTAETSRMSSAAVST